MPAAISAALPVGDGDAVLQHRQFVGLEHRHGVRHRLEIVERAAPGIVEPVGDRARRRRASGTLVSRATRPVTGPATPMHAGVDRRARRSRRGRSRRCRRGCRNRAWRTRGRRAGAADRVRAEQAEQRLRAPDVSRRAASTAMMIGDAPCDRSIGVAWQRVCQSIGFIRAGHYRCVTWPVSRSSVCRSAGRAGRQAESALEARRASARRAARRRRSRPISRRARPSSSPAASRRECPEHVHRVLSEGELCREAGLPDLETLRSRYYSARDLRGMYPALRDDHLRYLEKWGLIRPVAGRYSFADLHVIKQAAAELERGVSLHGVLRALASEQEGQLAFDFQPRAPERTPARVVSLPAPPRRRQASLFPRRRIRSRSPPPITRWPRSISSKAPSSTTARSAIWTRRPRAYRRAVLFDPQLVPAIVNLANIHYERDELVEAEALYEKAIRARRRVLRGVLQPRQHPSRSGALSRGAQRLSRRAGDQPGLSGSALLSGGDAGEARPIGRGAAALAAVPRAGAGRRVRGAGEGVFGRD